jgi:hypothetical protein
LLAAGVLGLPAPAVELKRETLAAFERYVRQAESKIALRVTEGDGFLLAITPERRARLRSGAILIESRIPRGELNAPAGLIHDWVGAVFIRGAAIGEALSLMQAYDDHKEYYPPEVIASRLIARNGNDFRVVLRLLKRKVLAVVLDTEHEVHYEQRDEKRWWSWSHSTRILEIQNPGARAERALPPDTGHGFLWRLNSYWTFQELDNGTYVECEAISLTRNVPVSVRWLIDPIVRKLPRESLTQTLRATRAGVVRRGRR